MAIEKLFETTNEKSFKILFEMTCSVWNNTANRGISIDKPTISSKDKMKLDTIKNKVFNLLEKLKKKKIFFTRSILLSKLNYFLVVFSMILKSQNFLLI